MSRGRKSSKCLVIFVSSSFLNCLVIFVHAGNSRVTPDGVRLAGMGKTTIMKDKLRNMDPAMHEITSKLLD